ncbi:MAG: glycosyltransferase family 4 protein [Bacteroidia bacterium]
MDRKVKEKVLILQRIFSDYRKPVFDRLARRFDLKLLYSKNKSGIRQVSANYAEEVPAFHYLPKETTVFQNVLAVILKFRPKVIIHEIALGAVSMYFSFILAKLLGIKFIFWGHGFDRTKGFNPNSPGDKLRLFLMRKADAVILYGNQMQDVLKKHLPAEKLFVARNTIDTDRFLRIKEELDERGREQVKAAIGFRHRYNLVFIGRLLEEKRPEILLNLLIKLREQGVKDVAVHFIGDGPEKEAIEQLIIEKKLRGQVFLHGSIHDPVESGKFLYAADLMVMPGYLGLSVNHAFCFSCPVVSFRQGENGPFHSPEAENIVQNQTGYLAKNDDLDDMAAWIGSYLKDDLHRSRMQQNTINLMRQECALENMVKQMSRGINYTIQENFEMQFAEEGE